VVLAYGESAPIIEHDLGSIVPVERLASSFGDVISAARRVATPGDVVLLSPACSSYDMFENYEQRGREFKRLVGVGNGARRHPPGTKREAKT
jgi:UDP-N-acetylmuramoylalanine--D-glutamate ligase